MFYVTTKRHGREMLGNVGHLSMILRNMNVRTAVRRARRASRCQSRPGDLISVESVPDSTPYAEGKVVAVFSALARTRL